MPKIKPTKTEKVLYEEYRRVMMEAKIEPSFTLEQWVENYRSVKKAQDAREE